MELMLASTTSSLKITWLTASQNLWRELEILSIPATGRMDLGSCPAQGTNGQSTNT